MKKIHAENSPFKKEFWGQSKITQETRDKIINDYKMGIKTKDIIEKYKITRDIFYYALNHEKRKEQARKYQAERRSKGLIDKKYKNECRYKTRRKKVENHHMLNEIGKDKKDSIRKYHREYLKNWRKEKNK